MGKLDISDIHSFDQTRSADELEQLERMIRAELWDHQIKADSAAGKRTLGLAIAVCR